MDRHSEERSSALQDGLETKQKQVQHPFRGMVSFEVTADRLIDVHFINPRGEI